MRGYGSLLRRASKQYITKSLFLLLATCEQIAIGGTQKVDSKASLAWKADMKDISLKYKHKLTNSLELGAGTSLPYVTSVTGVNFDLTYTVSP